MFQKIIILITSTFLLTGCADGFKGYFKKSANNKWIDSKGFQGGKRKPLYNKKYISLAKKNVLDENYDEIDDEIDFDDYYETRSPSKSNREMYQNMLKADAKRRQRQNMERGARLQDNYEDEDYPSLNKANERITKTRQDDNSQLQKELAEIKEMLSETKTDLTKYKCPIEGDRVSPSPRAQVPAKNSGGKSKASNNKTSTNSTIPQVGDPDYHPI
jgi:hypothetical protein